jgi:hypothetical protein
MPWREHFTSQNFESTGASSAYTCECGADLTLSTDVLSKSFQVLVVPPPPAPCSLQDFPTHSTRPYIHPYVHSHIQTYFKAYIHTLMNASALFLPELLALGSHAFDPKLEKLEQTQGQEGRGMLVSKALNIYLGPLEDRVLVTGLSTVRDVHCRLCSVCAHPPCRILPDPADAGIARQDRLPNSLIKRGNRRARALEIGALRSGDARIA